MKEVKQSTFIHIIPGSHPSVVKDSPMESHSLVFQLCICHHVLVSSWRPPTQQEQRGNRWAKDTQDSWVQALPGHTYTSGCQCQMGHKRCPKYPPNTNTYPDSPYFLIRAFMQLPNCTTTFYGPINTWYPIRVLKCMKIRRIFKILIFP